MTTSPVASISDEQLADIEAYSFGHGPLGRACVTHGDVQGLIARLRDAEKDAARYRWLRNPAQDVAMVLDKVTGHVPVDSFGAGGYATYEYRAGEELDQAIDTAMEQHP